MEFVGIERNIDDLGRIVIPKELRKQVNIVEGDTLEIFATKDGSVIIRKKSTTSMINVSIPNPEEPRIYTIEDNYNNRRFIIKITREQDRLLDYLLNEDLLDSEVSIHSGYPDTEDLT